MFIKEPQPEIDSEGPSPQVPTGWPPGAILPAITFSNLKLWQADSRYYVW